MNKLPQINLKGKLITFDDRLQQVRVLKKTRSGGLSHAFTGIKFMNYKDDDGFFYVKKYRKNWANIIHI